MNIPVNEWFMRNKCRKAHAYSWKNKEMLQKDSKCGCFFCGRVFSPSEIKEWTREADGQETAVCPYCFVDAIIGEGAGYPLTKEFLSKMRDMWFET